MNTNACKLILLLFVFTLWCQPSAGQIYNSGTVSDALSAVQKAVLIPDFKDNSVVATQSSPFPGAISEDTAEQKILSTTPKSSPPGKILVSVIKSNHGLIEIHGSERIKKYDVYTLTRPSRLVIEINNAVSIAGDSSVPINKFGISSARFENNPKYLRIIFDAAQGRILPYRIEESKPSLNIIVTTPAP
jgi:hypothetical protein